MRKNKESQPPWWWIVATFSGLVLIIFSLVFVFAQRGPDDLFVRSSNGLSDDRDQRGKQLYQRYCASCHGPDGRGEGPAGQYMDPPPMNFHSDTARMSDDRLFTVITEGKISRGMPAWGGTLSSEQRRAIIDYLRLEFIEHGQDP